ncbi:MAG: nucleotidyltransferase domain-containing protein [Nanoarchaeota archaeon]|nr:nucleotidyltransferase domain-containing protein [Nanoarchaeota archaeon]MBU0963390.1 nucleotidyltransferase domain-containing protein [Nanoarchaeota archaeon]
MDNKLKIINYLGKNLNQSFSMHELSKLIKIPYATFYRTIQEMKDLIRMQNIGKSKIISLNTENPAVKSYLIISSDEEKKDFLKKHSIINKIASELQTKDTVILFGSYAKENEKESSDIDMLIISKDGKKTISFSKYEILFKKKINPIFITKSEFRQMLKEKEENVGKQALKKHIILQNPENFWGCVLNG